VMNEKRSARAFGGSASLRTTITSPARRSAATHAPDKSRASLSVSRMRAANRSLKRFEAAPVLLIPQSRRRLPRERFGRLSGLHDGVRHRTGRRRRYLCRSDRHTPISCYCRRYHMRLSWAGLLREVMLTHAWRAPVSGAKGAGGTCGELTINSGRGLINIAHNLAIFWALRLTTDRDCDVLKVANRVHLASRPINTARRQCPIRKIWRNADNPGMSNSIQTRSVNNCMLRGLPRGTIEATRS
jgi:hypothetical protein